MKLRFCQNRKTLQLWSLWNTISKYSTSANQMTRPVNVNKYSVYCCGKGTYRIALPQRYRCYNVITLTRSSFPENRLYDGRCFLSNLWALIADRLHQQSASKSKAVNLFATIVMKFLYRTKCIMGTCVFFSVEKLSSGNVWREFSRRTET